EFIDGQPLNLKLREGHLLESEVLVIGRDVSAAIAEIWSRTIVHGDIKPSNIMLLKSAGYATLSSVASAVLIDLGVARHLDQETATLRPSRHLYQTTIPAALKPLGTMGYFSPEQIRGIKALTCASDVFSLGVVMLQCLLGRHPTDYDQDALADGIKASGARLAVSPALTLALDKMLLLDPRFRPDPSELSRRFQGQQQRIEAQFAMGAPTSQKTQ